MIATQDVKDHARMLALRAKGRGLLAAQPCEACGSAEVEMHHDDYEQPLVVRWFCRPCHRMFHKKHGPRPQYRGRPPRLPIGESQAEVDESLPVAYLGTVPDPLTPEAALRMAIRIVGSRDKVGRLYKPKISAQAVQSWKLCPAERVPALVAACHGKITPHELRPDLYAPGAETPAPPAGRKRTKK